MPNSTHFTEFGANRGSSGRLLQKKEEKSSNFGLDGFSHDQVFVDFCLEILAIGSVG